MDEREKQAYLAKLAEQAERYDEMVEAMKKVARLDVELTAEERNLLSFGYKNVIEAKRASWRILSSIEQNDEAKGNEHNVRRIKDYIKRVEDDLAKICNEILSIIAIHLLPSSTAGESIVFFYKMKGDYYRYLAEFKTKNERKEAADQSLKAYQAATSTAMMDLPPTHSIRLGLALNLSVFYYEILNSPERACHLAKQAFDEAIAELNTLSAESYKESTLIMQLLKDNLTLWTSDLPEESAKLNSDVASPLIVRTPKPRRHHRLLPSPHRLNVVAPPRERCCLRPSPRLGNVVPRRPNASVSPATIHNLRRASEQQPKATDMITDS